MKQPSPACFIIMPGSAFRKYWEVAVILMLIYTVVVLPLNFAFEMGKTMKVLEWVVDCLFFTDILVSFVSAYETSEGVLVTQPKLIAKRYVKGWFVLDVLATFPFQLFVEGGIADLKQVLRVPRLLKIVRLMRLFKLLRAYRFKKFFEAIEYSPRIHQGFLRLTRLFVIILTFGHFSACLWYFLGDLSRYDDGTLKPESWIARTFEGMDMEFEETAILYRYTVSLYWSITTLATVGYGDITPMTYEELWFSIPMLLIGATTFSFIAGTLSSVVQAGDRRANLFRERMSALLVFMRRHGIPVDLQHRVIKEMQLLWKSPGKHVDIREILDDLPRALCYEISLKIHEELIERSHFLKHFSVHRAFVGEWLSKVAPKMASHGEFLYRKGDPASTVGIIHTGIVEIVSSKDGKLVYLTLPEGDVLGLIGMFVTQTWTHSVKCASNVLIYEIPVKELWKILVHHKSVSREIAKVARERYEKITDITKKRRSLLAKGLDAFIWSHRESPSGRWETLRHKILKQVRESRQKKMERRRDSHSSSEEPLGNGAPPPEGTQTMRNQLHDLTRILEKMQVQLDRLEVTQQAATALREKPQHTRGSLSVGNLDPERVHALLAASPAPRLAGHEEPAPLPSQRSLDDDRRNLGGFAQAALQRIRRVGAAGERPSPLRALRRAFTPSAELSDEDRDESAETGRKYEERSTSGDLNDKERSV
ncbi:MAG: hypothetical protein MHM6MM_001316 [Cercozoa sp. M6MM]